MYLQCMHNIGASLTIFMPHSTIVTIVSKTGLKLKHLFINFEACQTLITLKMYIRKVINLSVK